MSALNSPEKASSDISLSGSLPQSWSDVQLIEDITQDRKSSPQPEPRDVLSPTRSLDSSENPATSTTPVVCVVKRFRARSRSRIHDLPIASASDTIQTSAVQENNQPLGLPLTMDEV